MKAILRPFALVLTSILLINWGSQDSTSSSNLKPAINFYGTIKDNTGATFNAENITIAGQYRQISVHPLPQLDQKNSNYDPNVNTARLDFSEIASIVVPNPHLTYTFKNRDYIMIEVISKDDKKERNSYIIEMNKKLFCDQLNGAGPLEREINFVAVESISFDGYKTQEQKSDAQTIQKKPKALMKPADQQ